MGHGAWSASAGLRLQVFFYSLDAATYNSTGGACPCRNADRNTAKIPPLLQQCCGRAWCKQRVWAGEPDLIKQSAI